METQLQFDFWDKVIDKKELEYKQENERRKYAWIEKNLKNKVVQLRYNESFNQFKYNKSWENI